MRVMVGSNARRATRRLAAWSLCVLPALSLACGADASDVAEESTRPALSPAPDADGDTAQADARAETDPPGQATEDGASLALPSRPPLGTPVEPTPPPTPVLETTRPIAAAAPDEVEFPGECRFEYLGEWVRCENPGSARRVETDAADLEACMQRCLERDDCTAVTDYHWRGQHDRGCVLHLSRCDEPALASDWAEEDGGREFRLVCDGDE
jgi:hypothetical protein